MAHSVLGRRSANLHQSALGPMLSAEVAATTTTTTAMTNIGTNICPGTATTVLVRIYVEFGYAICQGRNPGWLRNVKLCVFPGSICLVRICSLADRKVKKSDGLQLKKKKRPCLLHTWVIYSRKTGIL